MAHSAGEQTRTIVLGYDGSEASEDALRLAKAHAEVSGARLLAVFSYPSDIVGREAAELLLHSALRGLTFGQPAGTRAVADRPVAAALSEIVRRERAELLVVGAGNPALIHELRLTAPCPLAVAPRGFADEQLDVRPLESRREVA